MPVTALKPLKHLDGLMARFDGSNQGNAGHGIETLREDGRSSQGGTRSNQGNAGHGIETFQSVDQKILHVSRSNQGNAGHGIETFSPRTWHR